MSRRRCLGGLILLLLCLFILTAVYGKNTALAQAVPEDTLVGGEGIKVDIVWGNNSLVRVGQDAPITVRVTSTGAELTGIARAIIPAGNSDYYIMEESLSVKAGEQRQVILSVPVTYDTDVVDVEFQGEDGVVYGSRRIRLRADYGNQEIYMAVVSNDAGQLALFDRVILNEYRETTTRLFDFKENTLPTDVNVLKLYDILLWDDVKWDTIREEQRETLDSWVYGGGILIVGADSGWPQNGEKMTIRRENWGRGLYVYCGFPLREVLVSYPEEKGVRRFLYEAVGESRMTAIEENMEDTYGDYWAASNMTSGADAERIPHVWQYTAVLLIYLVLLGPVLYSILKKKQRRNLLRVSMIGIALIFTLIIYMMGSRTRFYRPFMNYASVREIRSGVMVETVYANVFSPSNSDYTLGFQPEYDVVPLMEYDYEEEAPGHEAACRLRICRTEKETQVWIRDNIPFTGNVFRLTGTESSSYGNGFTGDVTLFEEGLEGILRNDTDQDFEQVCVMAGGRVALVGNMPAGTAVDLAQYETQFMYSSQQTELLERMAGVDRYTVPGESREASQAARRYRMLYSYIQDQWMNESGTALVIGFPATETVAYVNGSSVEMQGTTLVTEVISLRDTKNGLCYRSMGIEDIEILQGNYNYKRNSTTDPLCVLCYDLGDIQAETLMIQWPICSDDSGYMKAYDQAMEFYNWDTSQYDRMEQKDRYSRYELTSYLDETNGLTVRYGLESTPESFYEVFLPNLSILGRRQR